MDCLLAAELSGSDLGDLASLFIYGTLLRSPLHFLGDDYSHNGSYTLVA